MLLGDNTIVCAPPACRQNPCGETSLFADTIALANAKEHIPPTLITAADAGLIAHNSAAPVSALALIATRTANANLFCFTALSSDRTRCVAVKDTCAYNDI